MNHWENKQWEPFSECVLELRKNQSSICCLEPHHGRLPSLSLSLPPPLSPPFRLPPPPPPTSSSPPSLSPHSPPLSTLCFPLLSLSVKRSLSPGVRPSPSHEACMSVTFLAQWSHDRKTWTQAIAQHLTATERRGNEAEERWEKRKEERRKEARRGGNWRKRECGLSRAVLAANRRY